MQVSSAIFKCPKCSALIAGLQYISGNTFGQVVYSDTYKKAPMGFPPWGGYTGCSQCNSVFKKSGNIVESNESTIKSEKFKKATENIMPIFEMMKNLLGDEQYSPDTESRKAFLLWYLWSFNHLIDDAERDSERKNGNHKKYTDELLICLDQEQNNPNSKLLKAEVLRERGEFDQALEALNFQFPPNLEKIAVEEKRRIGEKNSSVFSLKDLG